MAEEKPLLREDTRLPHAHVGLSRKRARAFLNARVLPALLPGRTVTDLTQRRIRYKPGRECRVHYRLRIEDGESHHYQVATLTYRRGANQPEAGSGDAPAENGSLRGRTVYVSEQDCLVEFFPADRRLPGLAGAADPELMTERLRRGGSAFAGWRVIRAHPIRYRPGFTCVLRYLIDVPGEDEPHHVIGKVYPVGDLAEQMRLKLHLLSDQAAAAGLTIPGVIDVPQADDLVLMEKVPGANMDKLLLATTSEAMAAPTVRLAAEALAMYHNLTLERPRARLLDHDQRRLRQRLQRVRRVAPELGRAAYEIIDAIDLVALAAPPHELSPVHGDFKPNQLLIDEGRPALLDFDRSGLGDPAVDLGNFMAVLRKKAIINELPHLRPLAEAFLARYLEQRPCPAGVERRARSFEAIALARVVIAKFERSPRSYVKEGAEWPWLSVLDEARRCLVAT